MKCSSRKSPSVKDVAALKSLRTTAWKGFSMTLARGHVLRAARLGLLILITYPRLAPVGKLVFRIFGVSAGVATRRKARKA